MKNQSTTASLEASFIHKKWKKVIKIIGTALWLLAVTYLVLLRFFLNLFFWQTGLVIGIICSFIVIIFTLLVVIWAGFTKIRPRLSNGYLYNWSEKRYKLRDKPPRPERSKGFYEFLGVSLGLSLTYIFGVMPASMEIQDLQTGPIYYHGACEVKHEIIKTERSADREIFYLMLIDQKEPQIFMDEEKYAKTLINQTQFGTIKCKNSIQLRYLAALGIIIDFKIDQAS